MPTVETDLIAWNEETLAEIGKSSLLSEEDLEKIELCKPAIVHAFHHVQMFRTPTEMRISVLNDVSFPNPDSKYWQSVREMAAMAENLAGLTFQFKKKMVDLRKKEWELGKLACPTEEEQFSKELLEIEIEELKYHIMNIQREAHHRIREINEWQAIQKQLIPLLSCGTEDVNNHQLFSLTFQFLQQFKIAEEGKVNKDLDGYRNLVAHVVTSLNTIRALKSMGHLVQILKQNDMDLFNFVKRKQLITQEEAKLFKL